MLFNSIQFAIFLPIVFLLYWFVFHKSLRLQNGFVVVASYVFYGWWDWKFLFLIAFTSFCSYFAGLLIDKFREQPVHDYDIVYGPIADDGVTYQLRRYEGGVISLPRLVEELKYAKGITFQYFFGTERALKQLKRL